MNSKINRFNVGDKFEATIRAIRTEGVYIDMPGGGSGIASPACWGSGEERAKALATIKPGDNVPVIVKSYNSANRSLSLLLDGGKLSLDMRRARPAKLFRHVTRRTATAKKTAALPAKPVYKPIPYGSTLLIDCANLLSMIGPVDAARNLKFVGRELEQRGFKVAFFLERRAWGWGMYNQISDRQAAEWREFSHDARLSLVDGESDLAMLQVGAVLDDAYLCTRDHLADYARTYREIVRERRRSFSVTNLCGRILLAIDGLVDAIAIDPEALAPERDESQAQCEHKSAAHADALPIQSDEKRSARPVLALAKHGRLADPVRYLSRVAEKDHRAYCELAELFSGKDAKRERRYLRLAAAAEKRNRETRLRDRRRFKAAERGEMIQGHFSHRKQNEIGIVEFARVHDDIASYLAARRRASGRIRRCAA